MSGKLFIILLLLVTPGEARKSFLRFLNIQNPEMLSFTKPEETVIVRSSYEGKRPHSSYLLVKLEDPTVLQVVNVTKTSLDFTDFTINLKTFPGETNLTMQLWESEGRQTRLIEEITNIRVSVFRQTEDSLFQEPIHVNSSVFLLVLLMILLNKCAFGCKIELQVLQTVWKRPLPILLGAVTQFFLMPFCGFLLSQILGLSKAQAFGFVMTCTCPGGGGGYLFALLLEGDVTLAILMACTSTSLALIMMPVNSYLYSCLLGLAGVFHVPVLKIVSTLLFILTPVSIGIVIKHRMPKKAVCLERVVQPLSLTLMLVGVYLAFRMGLVFLRMANLEVFLLGLLVPVLGFSFGYSFAKVYLLPLPVCKTVAIESGMLNSFLALAIIQLSFPQSKAYEASVAPFTVAMCSSCEMLLLLLVYKAKKRPLLSTENEKAPLV
ncbi:sodium/bile acid cotransporter 5 precursor [Rattus norvegicus]|uniref:Sodium/bile acid cotransporter 5 n=1 Tax=Rattus norvegicus TaxID=10116 RepID=NTCP5_RAT|nr:sodium/bile acid cotransporter 5 precursor [Rattus norvegicus]Q4JLT5.1 RecName: Full=Sodium/bile acid cotransporter 5; AltName: Full=Na(+)/bile acid cotransporter 5; AltName: Full=Solute carrier family 10 member 5; Flags: Precursor [Rattus norvegicus]AAY85181.1 SLC10A5 [Rattus norvegicus]|eukprot:NP_001020451.1 sodium/bile acid cotransporter 5 precursor [Rattus norvegicus]